MTVPTSNATLTPTLAPSVGGECSRICSDYFYGKNVTRERYEAQLVAFSGITATALFLWVGVLGTMLALQKNSLNHSKFSVRMGKRLDKAVGAFMMVVGFGMIFAGIGTAVSFASIRNQDYKNCLNACPK